MYCPILKSKRSEGLALRHLDDSIKRSIVPLIDLAAPTSSGQIDNPPKFVERNIKSLTTYLPSFERVMIDSSEMDADIRTPNGLHPLFAAAEALSEKNIGIVPVTGLDRDHYHQSAVLDVINLGVNTIGIRVDPYDLETPTMTATRLNELRRKSYDDKRIILIYDLQNIYGKDVHRLLSSISELDGKLRHTSEEMTVVSGSGLPEKMAVAVPTKSSNYLRRVELDVWKRLSQSITNERNVVFGDYATVTPGYVQLDFRLIHKQIGPKIIYALDEEWFVIRGGSFEQHPDGWTQYYALAEEITKLDEYPGEEYCYGDRFIGEKADGIGTTGSPGSWVTVCVNRHITYTSRNIP